MHRSAATNPRRHQDGLLELNSGKEATTIKNREVSMEMMEVLIFQVVAPTVPLFLVPTSKYRRKEWGTGIGSRHSHSAPFRA